MGVAGIQARQEAAEVITPNDLAATAHALMDGITLDVASSKFANDYVGAEQYYTPTDDGLNEQQWFGNVYLFPPSGTYFWEAKRSRWTMTRSSSPTLVSSHAVWFRKLYKQWMARQITQGLYFTNCPDMIRYEQKLFDFPVCILRTPPILIYHIGDEVKKRPTCTSLLVYFPPVNNVDEATEKFVDLYSPKGRVLL